MTYYIITIIIIIIIIIIINIFVAVMFKERRDIIFKKIFC